MAWWSAAWTLMDDTLRGWSEAAQGVVSKIRLARNAVGAFIFLVYALVAGAMVWPQYDQYLLGVAIVLMSVLVWVAYFLVGLPLRAKSVVRLIDQGYPANTRELALRVAARKLHEESIETEELLAATAWNEGRKAYHKYKAKALELKRQMDEAEAQQPPDAPVDGPDEAGKP